MNKGKIIQVMGPVVDVEFEDGKLVLGENTLSYDAEKDTLTDEDTDQADLFGQDSVTYTRQ